MSLYSSRSREFKLQVNWATSCWKALYFLWSWVTKLGRTWMINKLVVSQTKSWPQLNFSESMGCWQPIKFLHFFVPPSLRFCFTDNGLQRMDEKLITTIQIYPVLYFFDLKDYRNKMIPGEQLHQSLRSMLKDMVEHFAHLLLCAPVFHHVVPNLKYFPMFVVVSHINILT